MKQKLSKANLVRLVQSIIHEEDLQETERIWRMTRTELDAALRAEGVDPEELARRARLLLSRLKNESLPQEHFSDEDIRAVQAAIDRAHEDMEEWREASRIDPLKMIEPIGPLSRVCRRMQS